MSSAYPIPEPLATPPEAATYTGLTVGHLARLRCKGEGPPYVKLGSSVRYRWSDVESWVNSCVVEVAA